MTLANPIPEPEPDPMMDELREIRDSTGALISTMSSREVVQFFAEKAQEVAEQNGRVLVPHPTFPNAQMLIKKEALSQP